MTIDENALDVIVDEAIKTKVGARGLRSIVEKVLLDDMCDLPGSDTKELSMDKDYVTNKLKNEK